MLPGFGGLRSGREGTVRAVGVTAEPAVWPSAPGWSGKSDGVEVTSDQERLPSGGKMSQTDRFLPKNGR